MCKDCITVYKTARETKGYTQEKAAELLNVSVGSIQAYEGGKTQVPNDIVVEMCNIYGNERLAYQHLRLSAVGKMVLPDIDEKVSFTVSMLMFLKQANDLIAYKDDLIVIGADGVIDESERKRFDEIITQMGKFKATIYNLEFSASHLINRVGGEERWQK